jgi:hypothetical protein
MPLLSVSTRHFNPIPQPGGSVTAAAGMASGTAAAPSSAGRVTTVASGSVGTAAALTTTERVTASAGRGSAAASAVSATTSGGGQLGAGVRASAGTVGYLGSSGALTVLNPGNTLPGGWSASWDGSTLEIGGSNVTIDHYRINAEVVFTGSNPTMTNCDIHTVANALYGVTSTHNSYLTISDTTVVGNATGAGPQQNGISSDWGLIATRCDVSNTGDGIHYTAMPTTPSKISQCYVHDLAFIDEEQHCDGLQCFNHPTLAALYTIEHTTVTATTSTLGTPMSGATTAGPPTSNSEPLVTGTYDNNLFAGGLYHLRINFRHQNTVVTNNNLGSVNANEFGLISVEQPSAITTWTNNRTGSGAAGTGTLISQP